MTKAYFKWDGREGITAIMGISMIQVLVIGDIVLFIIRLIYDRSDTAPYSKLIGYSGVFLLFTLIAFNYFKYRKKYNKFRSYWKNETRSQRIIKGILVVLSLIIPWIPLILIGVFW